MNLFQHFGVFAMNAAYVGLGGAIVLFVLGRPRMRYLPGKKFFKEFMAKVTSYGKR